MQERAAASAGSLVAQDLRDQASRSAFTYLSKNCCEKGALDANVSRDCALG